MKRLTSLKTSSRERLCSDNRDACMITDNCKLPLGTISSSKGIRNGSGDKNEFVDWIKLALPSEVAMVMS